MKFLILITLLPCLAFGITDSWDNEETFTLKGDHTSSPPAKHGPVRIPLSESVSTTEDSILPLILKKLIEQSINNEIEQEKKYNESKSRGGGVQAKTPLTYMTPPPALAPSTPPSSEEEDDLSTTTEISNSDEQGSSTSSTTTDSGEIDDFDTTIATIPRIRMVSKGSEEEDEDEELKNKTPLKMEQYAEKYQRYLPQTEQSMEKTPDRPKNVPTVPEEPEEDSTEFPRSQSTHPHMDRVEFPEHVEAKEDIESQEQPHEETSTSETISQNPEIEEQDENVSTPPSNPETTESEPQTRPVYYFFLRPKQYRISQGMNMINDNNGMISPPMRPYFSLQDSWRLYPQTQPQPQQSLIPFPSPSYKFPSFIAQDYENQMSSPMQYRSTYPMSSYRPTAYYNPMIVPMNYPQQPLQYLPLGSNIYPQYQNQRYLLQQQQPSGFMYQNPYMRDEGQMGQMYPEMSQTSPLSTPYMPMPRYSLNNYRASIYPNYYPSTSPYALNYDGNNNNYGSLSSPMMGYNNYNGMRITSRFNPFNNNL